MNDHNRPAFSRFKNFDAQSSLDEFNKHINELKSKFPSRQSMFESHGSPFYNHQSAANPPQWSSIPRAQANENAFPSNGRVSSEKTIPIHVERNSGETHHPSANSAFTNEPKMHFMPDNSFFRQKFQDNFANNNPSYEQSAEPRVHHIPIHVESRNQSTTPNSSAHVSTTPANPLNNPNSGTMSSQQNGLNSVQQTQRASSQPCEERSSSSARVIEVPVQICKSSSTPEASKQDEIKESANVANQTSNSVNESVSDPTLADPTKVYAMGYEPISAKDNTTKCSNSKDTTKQETPFDYVKEILDDLHNYEGQVNEFNGTSPEDKGYKFLDEMLTLCMLRLDCIDIDGNDELRKYRKSAINEVNRVASMLEAKVSSHSTNEVQNEIEEPASDTQVNVSNEPSKQEDPIPSLQGSVQNECKQKEEESNLEKAKDKKEKKPKKEGKRIIFKWKNKKDGANSVNTPNKTNEKDLDTNNNDLKDETSSTHSTDTTGSSTVQGKETAV